MATRVRSFSKVNLGLRIGPVRADGFHELATMYQTLALHDVVTVSAQRVGDGGRSGIVLTTDHPRIPVDARNTAWQMVERALLAMGVAAEVAIHIDKRLPVQGGMGAGSANAAAALLGLEREMDGWEVVVPALSGVQRLRLAAEVGSDVPLFLVGGAVLGRGRGELVVAMPDVTLGGEGRGGGVPCVVAMPKIGVSTPFAFREWDARHGATLGTPGAEADGGAPDRGAGGAGRTGVESGAGAEEGRSPVANALTFSYPSASLDELSLAYSSAYATSALQGAEPGTSGIVGDLSPHGISANGGVGLRSNLAGDTLLALVRTGIENDFEEVVFPYHPPLREIKRLLTGEDSGAPAVYAALSGSGSALFGLYRSEGDARAAQQRVQSSGTEAILTETLTRAEYWARMFADVG